MVPSELTNIVTIPPEWFRFTLMGNYLLFSIENVAIISQGEAQEIGQQ
jgi:hypothetical protein